MFEMLVIGIKTLINYRNLNQTPITLAELRANIALRHTMLIDVIVSLNGLDDKETGAAKQFWAAQTWFLVDYLFTNIDLFNKEFELNIQADTPITKDGLLAIIDKLIAILKSNNDGKKKILLQPLIDDSHATIPTPPKEKSSTNPTLVIQSRDSIAFVKKLTAIGQTVVIMDAANAQRPGAGAYERGTFQEALTRNTDLYLKVLADFDNVFQRAVEEGRTTLKHTKADLQIDVQSYQARFLEMILYFIKKTLINPDYFDRKEAIAEFFSYANQIYGQMQNTVLEIPNDQAYRKKCQIVDFHEVKSTKDLFKKDGTFKVNLADRSVGNCYIVEVAAPDCRKSEGLVDRSCTVDDTRRLNKDPSVIIRNSINCAIRKAVEVNADAIVLNAFGCKAFENNAELVAKIFAEALMRHQEQLKGKTIYFLDLDSHMCTVFGQIFNNTLSRFFIFNPQYINGVRLEVRPGQIQGVRDKEAVFAPTMAVAATYATIHGNKVSASSTFTPEERKSRNVMSLKAELMGLLLKTIEGKNVEVIHLPLLGAGKRKYHPADCIQALIEAIESVSITHPKLKELNIFLHIPEEQKYHRVINWLAMEREPDRKKELAKYYTLIQPERERWMGFGVGLFMTQVRTTTTDTWKSWTKITNNLYLGKIPSIAEANELHNTIHPRLVVSALEDFELAGVGLGIITPNIQTASGWAKIGVEHHHVMVKDGHADDFPTAELTKAVRLILQKMNNNEVVYVHCKAGRSRSATIVVLTLYFQMKLQGDSPNIQEIYDYLKTVRPEVSLTSVEIANIKSTIALVETHPELLRPEHLYYQIAQQSIGPDNIKMHISSYLSSMNGKADIAQLPTFKDLKYDALRNPAKADSTKKLLADIFESENGAWLPWSCRFDIPEITALRNEVLELLSRQLDVDKQLIMNALEIPVKQVGLRRV